MEATPEEDRVRERLDLIVPDLFAMKKYEQFVRRLFAAERGTWLTVRHLCAGLGEAEQVFEALRPLIESELMVLWVDHPTDAAYGYVHFYLPDFFWTNSAVYNRAILDNK
jgi:hypothetical protein